MRCSTHSATPASVQCARSPCRWRALARACRASRLGIGPVLAGRLPEPVIGFESMRPHMSVTGLDVVGQFDGGGQRLVSLLAVPVERQAYRVGVRDAGARALLRL